MSSRNTVLWLGDSPPHGLRARCKRRELKLTEVGNLEPARLAVAKGLIVRWPQQRLDGLLVEALCHGVKPAVLCEFADIPAVGRALEHIGAKRLTIIHTEVGVIVSRIACEPDTPAWRADVDPVGDGQLSAEDRILLRRAFNDCTRVQLNEEKGGSTAVYQAFARLGDSRAGPVALPFFVKFGWRADIARELCNYRECTSLHVPFNQRPNIDPARCALGFERGVIVGNFVERSEELQSVVDRGAGLPALQSLFNSALRGWRQQAHVGDGSNLRTNVLAREMGRCLPSRYRPRRRDVLERHAAESHIKYGTTLAPDKLEECFLALPPITYRYAMSHNDLHGDNVRVAGQDAILIDFASAYHGPLSADPATLDVSLTLNTGVIRGEKWDAIARKLYCLDALMRPPPPLPPENESARIVDAVRFLRQIALADTLDSFEYPTAIALQLLRKASYSDPREGCRHRRELAYALAERLALDIKDRA